MNLLQKKIIEASQKYYSGEDSGISDAQFDDMLEKLKAEDPNSPLLTAVGHGYQVEKDSTPGNKIKHKYGIVQSLSKIHSFDELPSRWMSTQLIASTKLDGLSVVLYYDDGLLTHALTRGTEGVGIDITSKVLCIDPECAKLKDDEFSGAVRGEILMSHENFIKYRTIHPEAKNERNAAAGLINKSSADELPFLSIVVYTVIGSELRLFYTYTEMHIWLVSNFKNVVVTKRIDEYIKSCDSFDETMRTLKTDWYTTYPADGIVISSNTLINSEQDVVGYDTLAYKFPDECAETEVIEVEWELSKAKNIIPVVHFKSIELEGTTVERASGLHAQNILENKIGQGSRIIVRKANQIIPQVVDVLSQSDSSSLLPTHCPACHTLLTWSGVHLRCPNNECSDSKMQDAVTWMNELVPTDGLGSKLIETFLIKHLGDDVSIEKMYEHGPIASFDGIQERLFVTSFNKLFIGPFKLSNAIKALNIPRFGDVLANNLEYCFDNVIQAAESTKTENIPSRFAPLGQADYDSLCQNIQKFNRINLIIDMIEKPEATGSIDRGKVAITGKLSMPRKDFEDLLRRYGYTPTSTINKETLFLITDDPSSNTTKNQKANQFNVTKISEDDFRTFYLND